MTEKNPQGYNLGIDGGRAKHRIKIYLFQHKDESREDVDYDGETISSSRKKEPLSKGLEDLIRLLSSAIKNLSPNIGINRINNYHIEFTIYYSNKNEVKGAGD